MSRGDDVQEPRVTIIPMVKEPGNETGSLLHVPGFQVRWADADAATGERELPY